MELTTPEAFIRFRCTGNEDIDKSRILQWKEQLQIWFKNGLQNCYFFIHLSETPIEFAKFVKDELTDVNLVNETSKKKTLKDIFY
jgi:hypothetical protein